MKRRLLYSSSMFILLMSFCLVSCNNSENKSESNQEQSVETDMSGPEYTSAYVCPMHCESSGSDQPGKCPVCGMNYVKNEKQPADLY